MAATKEISIGDKLDALETLQSVDSKIDEIRRLRGELPMEVNDLEDEIHGLETRIERIGTELKDLETDIANKKNGIKESEELIKKYEKQQLNVKNNREFDALNKEMEMQNLEIQLSEKKIGQADLAVVAKKELENTTKELLAGRQVDLKEKQKELKKITAETEKEEKQLLKESEKAQTSIEDRILKAYQRIRTSYNNGLAVVSVERDSCGGCFAKVPPQRQAEIRHRKKIIVCEHCGRILIDSATEE